MNEPRGATAADWYHFDFELDLGGNLLPCVPAAPDVVVASGSALNGKIGKIPSAFNRQGEAHGLKNWQKREITPGELALWRKDPRLNICVRTGPISGVYAIDVDIDNRGVGLNVSHELGTAADHALIGVPWRTRENSGKFLVPFRSDGTWELTKRIIETPNGRIELLADGQQFVAAGSHSSGVRYQWLPSLPSELPTLTLDQLNRVWTSLMSAFATPDSPSTGYSSTKATSLPSSPTTNSAFTTQLLTSCDDNDWNRIISALRSLVPHCDDNDTWSEVGYALLSLQTTRPVDRLWVDFSKLARKGEHNHSAKEWWEAHKTQSTRTDFRHIFTLARQRADWGHRSDPGVFQPVPDVGESPVDVAPSSEPEKRIVRIVDAAFRTNIQEISEVLRDHVYVQGNIVVAIDQPNNDPDIRRASEQLGLVLVSVAYAQIRLSELATFVRFDGRSQDWKVIAPPDDLVAKWLNKRLWNDMRPLDAIARAPFIREDGTICEQAGYDKRSRAFYMPSVEFPPVPEAPTEADARSALDRLRNVFHQFPWQNPASESAFLAHLFTEVTRVAIDRVPAFWYSAQYAGTGKSLLAEMPARLVHGATPARRPWPNNPDEMRKTLFASLLAGDRSIMFDNLNDGHKARSSELCAFITSEIWKDRKLGVSETHAVVNKSVVTASGNNITPVSDLSRRSLVIRLDANTPDLNDRTFEIRDLPRYVMTHRSQLLVNALTVIKAYLTSNVVVEALPLPSFEQWSHFVREPLLWLGLPDPCDTQNETDDETGSTANAIDLLFTHFAGREFTAIDVAHTAGSITDQAGDMINVFIASGCAEPTNPVKVGYWLRAARDKFNVNGKLKLVKSGDGRLGVNWRIEERP